jgi:hypothetical protein
VGCNCGRRKMQVTSANIAPVSNTAGEPTIGAREAARARAQAIVAAARGVQTSGTSDSGSESE